MTCYGELVLATGVAPTGVLVLELAAHGGAIYTRCVEMEKDENITDSTILHYPSLTDYTILHPSSLSHNNHLNYN